MRKNDKVRGTFREKGSICGLRTNKLIIDTGDQTTRRESRDRKEEGKVLEDPHIP